MPQHARSAQAELRAKRHAQPHARFRALCLRKYQSLELTQVPVLSPRKHLSTERAQVPGNPTSTKTMRAHDYMLAHTLQHKFTQEPNTCELR